MKPGIGPVPSDNSKSKIIQMKQTLLIFLFIPLVMAEKSLAQNTAPIIPDQVKILHPGKGFLNSVHIRALRDFTCKYENAEDVVWYAAKNGFVVHFSTDSTFARSVYKRNGYWVYTIRQYAEEKMPRPVRHIVKSNYYDYFITLVEEIEEPGEPVKYLVHLQDKRSWKNVLVCEGELQVVENKRKL